MNDMDPGFEPDLEGISDDYLPMDAKRLVERLHTALNSKDLENLRLCFQLDYENIHPTRPEQSYVGRDQMLLEWEQIFRGVEHFRADLRDYTIDGDVVWTEWQWYDYPEDGTAGQKINQAGVIIFGVEQGLLAWGRMYMQDVASESGES